MSALAKLYASRGAVANIESPVERVAPKVESPVYLDRATTLRRRIETAVEIDARELDSRQAKPSIKESGIQNYTAALDVLENVNAAFSDVFSKLQSAEAARDEFAAESESRLQAIQQLHYNSENQKGQIEDLKAGNEDLAEKLIAETARSAQLDHQVRDTERALADAQRRITELDEVCRKLHDGIHVLFGVDSPTHKALDRLGKD